MTFSRYPGPLNACPGYRWKLHALLLTPLLLIIIFIMLTHGVWGEQVRLYYLAARQALPSLVQPVQLFTDMAAPFLYFLYLVILLRSVLPAGHFGFRDEARRTEGKLLFCRLIFFGFLLLFLATALLKVSLGMPRPGEAWPPHFFSLEDAYHSFPSGHTTEIVSITLPLAFFFRKKSVYIALALFIALVGYSRIWLGWHHPIDILAGMLWGGLIARVICCSPYSGSVPESTTPVRFKEQA